MAHYHVFPYEHMVAVTGGHHTYEPCTSRVLCSEQPWLCSPPAGCRRFLSYSIGALRYLVTSPPPAEVNGLMMTGVAHFRKVSALSHPLPG